MVRFSGTSELAMTLRPGTERRRKRDNSQRSGAEPAAPRAGRCSPGAGRVPRSGAAGCRPGPARSPAFGAATAHRLQQHALEAGIEGEHLQFCTAGEERLHDRPAQRRAYPRGKLDRVLDPRRMLREGFDDAAHVADIDPFFEQVLQHSLHRGERQQLGNQVFDQLGVSRPMWSSSDWVSWRPSSSAAWSRMSWLRWVATTVLESTTV